MRSNGDGWNLYCPICGTVYPRSDEDVLTEEELKEAKKQARKAKRQQQTIHRKSYNPVIPPGKKIGA